MSYSPEQLDSFRILGLEPGDTFDEVERAYQGLIKTWDPNRFGDDQSRRRRAEKKLRQVNQAYERLSAELKNGTAPAEVAAAAVAVAAPESPPPPNTPARHWTESWRYLWIVATVLALAYLGVDSYTRFVSIWSTTKATASNYPSPDRDPTSITGYAFNQHVQVMPALGTDGYHWIMQMERMLDGREGLRVRHTDYDGPPGGREVHWSSLLHWLVAALAWVDHLVTHDPLAVSLERTEPWANTFVLLVLMIALPIVAMRRFGSIPAAILALSFITTYPYYEFSFVGYLDHHGLAASSDLMMVFFLACAGAGWLRNDKISPDNLTPVERALWRWLPDLPAARRWMIASGIATGTGLWISTASVIPAMFGVGLGALLSTGWLARDNTESDVGRADPTLWRTWGTAVACTSIFYYLLEYAPAHFSMRLEVNHPLYALAAYGAGDVLCRLCWLIQATAPQGKGRSAGSKLGAVWGENKLRLGASTAMVLVLPVVVLLGGEAVFVIRPGFLLNLHTDYILEFRTFFTQMSLLSPMQIAGGISFIPITALPMLLLLSAPDLQRQWKAVLGIAVLPALVLLALALVQIRWLGISCAMWCGGLVVAAAVTTLPGSAFRWPAGFRRPIAVLLLLITLVPFPVFTFYQWYGTDFNHLSGPTELDLTQIVTRDASQRIRARLGSEQGVILSGPTTTTWMMYFGGFKGVGTLYWENIAGLRAAAATYSARPLWEDAKKLIDDNHVTHICIFSWDAFAEEYARLGAGLRKPADDDIKTQQAQARVLQDSFVVKILTGHQSPNWLPNWLRAIPYHMPDHPWLRYAYVYLLEVVPEQTDQEARLHHAEYALEMGGMNFLNMADQDVDQLLQSDPKYYPAQIVRALVLMSAQNPDLAKPAAQLVFDNLAQASTLDLEDRVYLSIVLANSGHNDDAIKQAAACVAMADEKGMRHLVPERLADALRFAANAPAGAYPQATFDLGLSLLPTPLRVQVIAAQAAIAAASKNPARAVALYRQALALQPDLLPAQNGLILLLSTSGDASVRNGAEAVKLAETMEKTAHLENADSLELMACAYAEAGQWDDAIFYGNMALQFLKNAKNTEAANQWNESLQLILNHHPVHLS